MAHLEKHILTSLPALTFLRRFEGRRKIWRLDGAKLNRLRRQKILFQNAAGFASVTPALGRSTLPGKGAAIAMGYVHFFNIIRLLFSSPRQTHSRTVQPLQVTVTMKHKKHEVLPLYLTEDLKKCPGFPSYDFGAYCVGLLLA